MAFKTCGATEKLGSPDSNRITRAPLACARSKISRICTILPSDTLSSRWGVVARVSFVGDVIQVSMRRVIGKQRGSVQHDAFEISERRRDGIRPLDHAGPSDETGIRDEAV